MNKPFSQACVNNREAILSVLKGLLLDYRGVLEIGSGTGQHATYFSQHLPHIRWQTSDLLENHGGINAWIDDEGAENCLRPLVLDVVQPNWPGEQYDAVFTANSLHILSWSQVELLFKHLRQALAPNALLMVYGPFNYQGAYTSDSNARFDQWLKSADVKRGIRDIEAVNQLAEARGLQWLEDYEMPANNRLQVWRLTS